MTLNLKGIDFVKPEALDGIIPEGFVTLRGALADLPSRVFNILSFTFESAPHELTTLFLIDDFYLTMLGDDLLDSLTATKIDGYTHRYLACICQELSEEPVMTLGLFRDKTRYCIMHWGYDIVHPIFGETIRQGLMGAPKYFSFKDLDDSKKSPISKTLRKIFNFFQRLYRFFLRK